MTQTFPCPPPPLHPQASLTAFSDTPDFTAVDYSYFEKMLVKSAPDNPEEYCDYLFVSHSFPTGMILW